MTTGSSSSRGSASTARIASLSAAAALVLGVLWWGMTGQLKAMNQAVNDLAELKDPSPFRAALMGHLGKIHLGLQGYLSSGNSSLADQVLQSRKDFEASLPEFQKQNPRLFPKTAVEEIRRAFGSYKDAVDGVLEANGRRLDARTALDRNFARMVFLIGHNIKPLIHGSQPDAEQRKEAILNIENTSRAWHQNLEKAWTQPVHAAIELTYENDSRGASYLDRYGELELLPRERKLQKELRALWQSTSDQARNTFALEQVVTQASAFMESQRTMVTTALNRFLPAMPPAELDVRRSGHVHAMQLHLAGAVAIGLLSIASILLTGMGISRLKRGLPLFPDRTATQKTAKEAPPAHKEPTLEMNLKGAISRWTPAAEALYGYTALEMQGQPISRLFESESEIARLSEQFGKAHHTTFETIHKLKNGQVTPVKIEFRPLTGPDGHPTGIGLVCTRR